MDSQEYGKWIREVRGKMSREEFGKKICRYKNVDGRKVCSGYHRNEISNWEKGENLPRNAETVLSIALFEFDHRYGEAEDQKAYAKQRYQHAARRLQEFLQQELYCRNVHDALLILVCRKVLTFEDVLELEPELKQMVQAADLDIGRERLYALQRETRRIADSLCSADRTEDIREIIRNDRPYFYSGMRTFGERMHVCFESRQRYAAGISFADAVRIYAPNYRDSYTRIYTGSSISRRWIMDLCVHLRFNREEIEQMLQNAHLAPLSADAADEAFYHNAQCGFPIGSAAWYQQMEAEYPDAFPAHYAGFRSMKIGEKMEAAVLLCTFISEVDNVDSVVPVDYLLESFSKYSCAKKARKALGKMRESAAEYMGDENWGLRLSADLLEKISGWTDYLTSGLCSPDSDDAAVYQVYQEYCSECRQYYQYPREMTAGLAYDPDLLKMRYLAALLYTVFTGRYYMGMISASDLEEIRKQLQQQMQDWEIPYFFINQFLVAFLGRNALCRDRRGGYYCIAGQKKTAPMDWEMVCSEIWELYIMYSDTV